MPRRATPDPTALAVGRRIRQLRIERQMTAERLAFEGEIGSKGYLSDVEHGLASPSLRTLKRIADFLGVRLLDLFTFPEEDDRSALVDCTRLLPAGALRRLLREMPAPPYAPSTRTSVYSGAEKPRDLLVAETTTRQEARRSSTKQAKGRPAGARSLLGASRSR